MENTNFGLRICSKRPVRNNGLELLQRDALVSRSANRPHCRITTAAGEVLEHTPHTPALQREGCISH